MPSTAYTVENLSVGIIDGKTLKQQFHYQHDQWRLLWQKESIIIRPFNGSYKMCSVFCVWGTKRRLIQFEQRKQIGGWRQVCLDI